MIPKLLKVVPVDEDAPFPRYVIEDQADQVWNGTTFVSDRTQGQLFADTNEACHALQNILRSDTGGRVLYRFKVPVMVEVYADPVSIVNPLDIAAWLSKTSHLQMATNENGVGPDNFVVLPVINWHLIESVKGE